MTRKYSDYKKARRFGRVVVAPVALFVALATLLSNLGHVIGIAKRDTTARDIASASGKFPYETPSFDVFEGVFTSDAQAVFVGT